MAGPYTQSAHGSSDSGAARTDIAVSTYSRGNCAHCHEQHAGIDGHEPDPASGSPSPYALFADNFSKVTGKPYTTADNFCFFCHATIGSLQAGGITNNDYAATFAGFISASPVSVFEAFNQAGEAHGSYHNLEDIRIFAENRFSFFSQYSNPCVVCHNPHRARRNKSTPSDPSLTVISRVGTHDSLWGDDDSERIRSYTSNYQAPYFEGSTSTYEPGGTPITDGSLTPDYNTFCSDCHNSTDIITSTPLERNLKQFSWSAPGGDTVSAGDKHGKNSYTEDVVTRSPYNTPAYVLSCLDCHEPHGSPHAFLIRRGVNGEEIDQLVTINGDDNSMGLLCRKCHQDDAAQLGNSNRINQWRTSHHGHHDDPTKDGFSTDLPYGASQVSGCGCHEVQDNTTRLPIPCGNCHGHGMFADASHPGTIDGRAIPAPRFTTTRRTF